MDESDPLEKGIPGRPSLLWLSKGGFGRLYGQEGIPQQKEPYLFFDNYPISLYI